ncbi:MAG: DUF2752 domain-containing protein [Gemmataceae bacterium]
MLFAAAAFVGGIAYLASVPPTESAFYPKCQLHSLTGLHCPGCGTTRAVHAALNGRFVQSLAYNALAWVVLPIAGIALVRSLWVWYRNSQANVHRSGSTVWPWVIGGALLLYGLLRNLPWYPFTLLAPHEIGG